jgi:NAD+ kinase
MSKVLLVVHPDREEIDSVAREIVDVVGSHGHEVVMPVDDANAAGLHDLASDVANIGEGCELALSIGGDGTMLRTVDLASRFNVPVYGVNYGQLGYLTEGEPENLRSDIERFFNGEHTLQERMRLRVEGQDLAGPLPVNALNDVVLERSPGGPTVNLAVFLDESYFTNYSADGLIVATPTGSTAYSLSARGPIVDPCHQLMLITPVSPHMLFDRSLVLESTTTIRLEVWGRVPAMVTADGRLVAELKRGESITCSVARQPAKLVTFAERNFHDILKQKFGLSDRPPQH